MDYKDFNIEISGKQGDEFDTKFSSGVSGLVRIKMTLNRTVEELLDALEGRIIAARSASAARTVTAVGDTVASPDDEVGEEVGQYLFDSLFSHRDSYRMLAECMTEAAGSRSGVRLRLTLNTGDPGVAELARLPWELMYGGEKYKYFARQLGTPLVRYLEVQEKSTVEELFPPLRIMVVAANPRGDLALDKERDNLKQALSDAVQKERIELTFVDNATIKTVADTLAHGRLAKRNFHVLHYMGHGDFQNDQGVLLMHKEGGGEDLVDADSFSDALKSSDLRLVFLNACNTAQSSAQKGSSPFGGVATALVRQGVPAVVAMQRPVPDRLAIALAKSFYPNIAIGLPVDSAVSEGRREMYFEDRDSLDWAIPVLFMRSPTGDIFPFAKGAAPPVVIDPPVPPPRDEKTFRPDPKPAPSPGWTWQGWAAATAGVAALLVASFAAYAWLGRPGKPSALLRQPSTSSLELETGKEVTVRLELLDDARNVVKGQALAKYPVDWKASTNNLTVTAIALGDDSKTIGATVKGTTPGATPVTITATLRDFPDLTDGEWKMTVVPSKSALDEFAKAYFAALGGFNDKTVEDTTVVAAYEQLHKTFPWIDGYVDKVSGFGPSEQTGARKIQETATKLAGVATAFEQARKADNLEERTLAERKKIWEGYKSASKGVRDGSPALTTADGTLADLDAVLKATLSVTELRTCAMASVSSNRCANSRDTFRPGESIAISVDWKAGPKSDRLVCEWGLLGADERVVAPKKLEAAFGGGRWWNAFTPDAAGKYEIRVKDRTDRFVARLHVTVQ